MNNHTKATVLIVEDDINLNLALVETLESYGYATMSAHHGQEALEQLAQSRPDVIVCDVRMPVMDGYTFLQQLRADPDKRLLPLIFLTAHSTTEDQRRAKLIGIEDYLSKPIDSKDLVAAIENALKRQRLMSEEIRRGMEQLSNRIVGLLQHEFRNPLAFVLGYAELLASGDENYFSMEELRMIANGILQGGRRLEQLIESFLLMAELQTYAQSPKHLEPVDAWSFCRDILNDLSSSAQNSPVTVRLHDRKQNFIINIDVRLIGEAMRRMYEFVARGCKDSDAVIELDVRHTIPYAGLSLYCSNFETPPPPPHRAGAAAMTENQQDEIDIDLGLTVARTIAQLHGGRLTIDHDTPTAVRLTLWLPSIDPQPADIHSQIANGK